MKRKTALFLIFIMLVTVALTGCGGSDGSSNDGNSVGNGDATAYHYEYTGDPVPVAGDDIVPSDYGEENNWMRLPEKTTEPVDVFYLYPTSWGVKDGSEYAICNIDLKKMRTTATSNAKKQATAFETAGNLYAPYYRQLAVAFVFAQPQEQRARYFGGVPTADAIAAFEYYMEHFNEGRPFILVGHSQGAAVLKELLFTYMKDHPEVYSRMVAAYIIGYSVTQQELSDHPWVRFAEGAEDTGVVISYNTEAPEIGGTNNTVLPGSIAINPISWTRSEAPARADQNPGSYVNLKGKMTEVKGLADATVDTERGTVICSSVDPREFKGKNPAFFSSGIYHSFDIAFYYESLRQNAQLRTDAFLLKNP